MTGQTILVADDDPATRVLLHHTLGYAGYAVVLAAAADDVIQAANPPDAYVIDLMMPGACGVDICRRLRGSGSEAPILILSASHRTSDRVASLDAGADDYLTKPFALQELLARLRARLRRHGNDGILAVCGLTIDRASRRVQRDGRDITLTRTEYNLLLALAENRGHVMTRTQLFERIWGYDFHGSSNILDVYIGYLRRKVEAPGTAPLLHTVRGVGYLLRDPAATADPPPRHPGSGPQIGYGRGASYRLDRR